jgi:N-acetylmuramoyl-L-alanine amidase CwlA
MRRMEIKKMFLTPNRYSRPQIPLKKVTKIAVHYVGNAGSSAKGNRNYFESLKDSHAAYASSHYIIGLHGEIIQCIPENEWSYATNDANGYSISIENCHPNADGKFTDATRKSLIELCADICKRYHLNPAADIIRHYDVTGKKCPLCWVTDPHDFVTFKKEVMDYMTNGGDDMIKIDELEKRVEKLENAQEKVFTTGADIPEWAKEAVEWAVDNEVLTGDLIGLNLTYTQLRLLVMLYRAQRVDAK